ncbi:sulfotransferase family protein [Filomicrobium sp.]|uniref:sulfotransferase family protein n=1 Tax=Filomicrobium sp. TaxID=2024831 RepID=UPI002586E062|nr:sulfotransferase family protein [Filomicrobium sp.]MCV0371067.1 sulfotransferase family protein [Filomicrobium sp.]
MITSLRNISLLVSEHLDERRRVSSPFFRKYPYSGSVWIRAVDKRGMIALDHGFFFNRVPKSANSTVAVALARACGVASISEDSDGNWAKFAFKMPSALSRSEVSDFDSTFKFTFVRNPYHRILSAYLDKVRTGRKTKGMSSFPEFCRFLDNGGLLNNAHWAPQSSILLLPIDRFDFIGRVEALNADLATVFAALDFPLPDKFSRAGPPATKAAEMMREHYTDECREIVARLYRTDFEAFGYEV